MLIPAETAALECSVSSDMAAWCDGGPSGVQGLSAGSGVDCVLEQDVQVVFFFLRRLAGAFDFFYVGGLKFFFSCKRSCLIYTVFR